MSEREIILEVGGEGGSITLYGVRTASGWRYQRNVVDQTMSMLDEEEIRHDSLFCSSWDEALALLDQYVWHQLYPLRVHPEFQATVWRVVQARFVGDNMAYGVERWNECCTTKG